MIQYTQGNLLDAPVEALVNTVNEVGVMGKGIALLFREAFRENTAAYEAACRAGEVRVGRMLVTENSGTLLGPRWIINFPTKKHWRNPSRLEYVRAGLQDLVRVVRELGIASVALPPLGCGSGGLQWSQVRPEIEAAAAELPSVQWMVYEPTPSYYNSPKRSGLENLTPARGMIVAAVRFYEAMAFDCSVLEVQKLGWFLQRGVGLLGVEDVLGLKFEAGTYGPYADDLRHVLNALDGSFLHCERRLADARPADRIWFEPGRDEEVDAFLEQESGAAYRPVVEWVLKLIDGFASPHGMELLATVDWLLQQPGQPRTVEAIRSVLEHWPGGTASARRKLRLFDNKSLELALDRLLDAERMVPRSTAAESPA